jgi:hypothetical protein
MSEHTVSIFYTACLRGQLTLLPKLYQYIAEQRNVPHPTMLIDLGQSCMAGAWICQATGGRGMLVAMDAMGYDAFHIGPLDTLYHYPELVLKIQQVVATPFAAGPWRAHIQRLGNNALLVNGRNLPQTVAEQHITTDLIVGLGLVEPTQESFKVWVEGDKRLAHMLVGANPNGFRVGRLDIQYDAQDISAQHTVLTMPPDIPPHPSMIGVLEFVESEARQAERKGRA